MAIRCEILHFTRFILVLIIGSILIGNSFGDEKIEDDPVNFRHTKDLEVAASEHEGK